MSQSSESQRPPPPTWLPILSVVVVVLYSAVALFLNGLHWEITQRLVLLVWVAMMAWMDYKYTLSTRSSGPLLPAWLYVVLGSAPLYGLGLLAYRELVYRQMGW